MREGLLWADDLKAGVEASIRRAAAQYLMKYGRPPSRCHVHPDVLGEVQIIPLDTFGVMMVPDPKIRPHELWIGIVEED